MKSLKKFGIMTGIMIVVEGILYMIANHFWEMEAQANGGIVEVLTQPIQICFYLMVILVFVWGITAIGMVVSYIVKKIKNTK